MRRRMERWIAAIKRLPSATALLVAGAAFGGAIAVSYLLPGTVGAGFHLVYIPVLFAGLRFGLRGGLAVAVLGGLAVIPLLIAVHGGRPSQGLLEWLVRTLVFMAVGTSGGLMSELERRSFRDGLTAVYSRAYFEERLEEEMARATRSGQAFTVVMVDVGDLQLEEGEQGAPGTRRALITLANSMMNGLRSVDCVSRYNNTVFAVILVAADLPGAYSVCLRLLNRVHKNAASPCIGLAEFHVNEDDGPRLIERAEAALRRARATGAGIVG